MQTTTVLFVLTSLLCVTRGKQLVNPVSFSLPAPPVLKGALAVNNALNLAEKLHNYGELLGPGSIVLDGEKVYVGTKAGKIYNVASCVPLLIADMTPPLCIGQPKCSQLVSMRQDPRTGQLLVLDTFRGLYTLDPLTGNYQLIFSARTPVQGRPPKHLNDLVVSSTGIVYMSDSSDTWDFNNDISIGIEGRASGRIIKLDLSNPALAMALPGKFVFPNGLELAANEQVLLIVELSFARVLGMNLLTGKTAVFAQNLPGLPDQIRASDHGTWWVGMHYPRHNMVNNPLDYYDSLPPMMKQMGRGTMTDQHIKGMFGNWGLAVELDANGRITRTIHDPKGMDFPTVTEVIDQGGLVYIGSDQTRFVGRIYDSNRVLTPTAQAQVDAMSCAGASAQSMATGNLGTGSLGTGSFGTLGTGSIGGSGVGDMAGIFDVFNQLGGTQG